MLLALAIASTEVPISHGNTEQGVRWGDNINAAWPAWEKPEQERGHSGSQHLA